MKPTMRAARMGAIAILCCIAAPAMARGYHGGDGRGSGCLPSSLRHTLAEVSQRFGHVQVISAHRPGARIAGSGHRSLHADCRAVDFNPPAGKYNEVVAWLASHHNGGLGTYSCGMHHIHIDNGAHVRFHKCEGGGTRHARRHSGRKHHAHRGGRRHYAQS